MENQKPMSRLNFSSDLENSAKDFFKVSNPENKLAERVEKYTEWDGELDEIVHYTMIGANGRDVLINIMLSDGPGSNNNKDILFGEDFNHFGVKVATNDGNEYCVVLEYASELGYDESVDKSHGWTRLNEKYRQSKHGLEREDRNDHDDYLKTPVKS